MGFNFPNAPTVGAIYAPGGAGAATWRWDGLTWSQIPQPGPTGPAGPPYETYGVSVQRAAGIVTGGYYAERSASAISTQGKLYGEVIAASGAGSVDFYVDVNGAMAYGPVTATLGTPVNLSGLTIAVPDGGKIAFVVTATSGGVTEFYAKLYGKVG